MMIIEGLHEKNIFEESYPFGIKMNIEEEFDYPPHWHSAIEIVYVIENDYNIIVNNKTYCLCENDVLFIASGDIHEINTHNNKGKRIFIQFDISTLDGFGNVLLVNPFLSQTRHITKKNDAPLHALLANQITTIIAEYEKKDFAYPLSMNARVYDILVILSRHFIDKVNIHTAATPEKKIHGLNKINNAFKYIEQTFKEEIGLKDVADAAGFSEFHFSRVFKEITEKSFVDYLKTFRIKKAEKLLLHSSDTITNIALSCGFNSIVTFNRAFKEVKGCTPSQYRKMNL